MQREVDFFNYCPRCENSQKQEWEEPCDECLFYPTNEDSAKPVNFKEKKEAAQNTRNGANA